MVILALLILFFILLIPVFFQIFFGSGLILIHKKVKYGHICITSAILWLVTFFVLYSITYHAPEGLAILGVILSEIATGVLIVLTIIIQIFIKKFKQKSLKTQK